MPRLVWVSCAIVILAAMTAAGAALGADHSAFDALLRRHVSDGLVDYDAFERAPDFRAYLDQRDSIRNIKAPGSPLKAPWAEPVARVGSRSYSLDALGPAERESLPVPLGRADRETLVRGVRRLLARDVIVLLRGLATSPAERARTSVRTAGLEWAPPQPRAARGRDGRSRAGPPASRADGDRRRRQPRGGAAARGRNRAGAASALLRENHIQTARPRSWERRK